MGTPGEKIIENNSPEKQLCIVAKFEIIQSIFVNKSILKCAHKTKAKKTHTKLYTIAFNTQQENSTNRHKLNTKTLDCRASTQWNMNLREISGPILHA